MDFLGWLFAFVVIAVMAFFGWVIYDSTMRDRACARAGGQLTEKFGCIKEWKTVPID